MFGFAPLLACCFAPAAGGSTAVVALDVPETAGAVSRLSKALAARGEEVQSREQMAKALFGTLSPRLPDVATLERMLDDARESEARFDSEAAAALRRNIAAAFEIAASAVYEAIAILLSKGDNTGAMAVAREALRRFGDVPVDPKRYSPLVRGLVQRAKEAVAAAPKARLTVRTREPATVFAEGVALGEANPVLTADLLPGRYRLWAKYASGWSLPTSVDVGSSAVDVTVGSELDGRLVVGEALALSCQESCNEVLVALGRRLGAARLVAVERVDKVTDTARVVDVDVLHSGSQDAVLDLTTGAPPSRPAAARFSALYLLPFGGAQLAQDRPVVAAGCATVELGLLGWYLASLVQQSSSMQHGDLATSDSMRRQRNLAVSLLGATMVAGVAEAMIYGLFASSGESP
jgi:hypothetical protein